MQDIIDNINQFVKKLAYLELRIHFQDTNKLVIVGSEDILYFHNFELIFRNVHTIICNIEWKLDNRVNLIGVVEGAEAYDLNVRFGVIKGNTIFKLTSEDDLQFYIIAGEVEFLEKMVTY